MRFCHECGANVTQQASFCPQCGTTLPAVDSRPAVVTEPTTSVTTASIPTTPVTPPENVTAVAPVRKSPVGLIVAIAVATLMVVGGGVWFLTSSKTYEVTVVVEAYDNLTFSRSCVPNTSAGNPSADALEFSFPQSGSGVSWEPASGVWTRTPGGNCQFEGSVSGPRGAEEFSARLTTREGGTVVIASNARVTTAQDKIFAQGDATIYETLRGTLVLEDQILFGDLALCVTRDVLENGGICGQLEILPPAECRGAGPWDDIGPDTFMLVLLPDGTELARERLGPGSGGQSGEWTASSTRRNYYEADCVFSFSMQVPRHTDGYLIETTDRDGIFSTLQEMDDDGWVLDLFLRRN